VVVIRIHGFDSFKGLPVTKKDIGWEKGFFKMDKVPDFTGNIEIVEGFFQDTLDKFLVEHPGYYRFIHIDCDLYSSTHHVLFKLHEYGRLKKGTIIVFDEVINYNEFLHGELLALYELCRDKGVKFKWLATLGGVMKRSVTNSDKFKNKTFKDMRKMGYFQEAAIEIL